MAQPLAMPDQPWYNGRMDEENGYEFVTRIMKGATNKGERLSARQVQRLVDQRGSGKMDTAQVQSHLRYAAERTGLIIKHKDKIVCPIRKRKVDTYSYNYTGIPNAFIDNEHIKMDASKDSGEVRFTNDKKMDKAFVDFAESIFKHDKKEPKEPRDAIVSTVQHHFTAEQLLDSLEALNQDLHDDVIVAIFAALGKDNYRSQTERKTALMSWAFIDGNLVVKE